LQALSPQQAQDNLNFYRHYARLKKQAPTAGPVLLLPAEPEAALPAPPLQNILVEKEKAAAPQAVPANIAEEKAAPEPAGKSAGGPRLLTPEKIFGRDAVLDFPSSRKR
jgi:hypothetical protein